MCFLRPATILLCFFFDAVSSRRRRPCIAINTCRIQLAVDRAFPDRLALLEPGKLARQAQACAEENDMFIFDEYVGPTLEAGHAEKGGQQQEPLVLEPVKGL